MSSIHLHINILILIFSSYGQLLARFYYSEVTEFLLFHFISTVGLLAVIVRKPDCILMVHFGCLYPNLGCSYGATQIYIGYYNGDMEEPKDPEASLHRKIQGGNLFGIRRNCVQGICVIDQNYIHNNARTQYNFAFSRLAHGAAKGRRSYHAGQMNKQLSQLRSDLQQLPGH